MYLREHQEDFRAKNNIDMTKYVQQKFDEDIESDPDMIRADIDRTTLRLEHLRVRLERSEAEVTRKQAEGTPMTGGMNPDQLAIHEWLVKGLGTRTGETAMGWLTAPDQEERLRKLGVSPERFLKEMEASR